MTRFKSGRTGRYYLQDRHTHKQKSLQTSNRAVAESKLAAYNESARVPELNWQLGAVYMAAADSDYNKRTWRQVAESTINPTDCTLDPSAQGNSVKAIRSEASS